MKSLKQFSADTMQNISSKSKNFEFKDPVDLYGKFLFKNLGRTIKFIAYVVAIFTAIVGICGAALIATKQIKFIAIALVFLLFFAALALIEFFIIYGIGHIIDQNNEILRRND